MMFEISRLFKSSKNVKHHGRYDVCVLKRANEKTERREDERQLKIVKNHAPLQKINVIINIDGNTDDDTSISTGGRFGTSGVELIRRATFSSFRTTKLFLRCCYSLEFWRFFGTSKESVL